MHPAQGRKDHPHPHPHPHPSRMDKKNIKPDMREWIDVKLGIIEQLKEEYE